MFKKPFGLLGIFLIIVGIGYFIGAGVAYSKVQGGYDSLQVVQRSAERPTVSYDEDGNLIDRGEVEGAPGDHVAAAGRLGLPGRRRDSTRTIRW